MAKWRLIVLACMIPALALLVFAGWTLQQTQLGHHPLPLPAIWMSNVLGTISVFFGLGWSVGGAWCVVQGYSIILVLVTIGVFIIPPFIGAVLDLPSKQDFRNFAARGHAPTGGWTVTKTSILLGLILSVIGLCGICVAVLHGMFTVGEPELMLAARFIIVLAVGAIITIAGFWLDSSEDPILNGRE